MSASGSIDLFAMKSFKVLKFLTLAAALSCGTNGSPTNITTDDYPKKASPVVLKGIMDGLQGLGDIYFKTFGASAQFTKEYVNRLAWIRPYNYVVCFVAHDSKFDGVKGQDWDHKVITFPDKDPHQPPIQYDVVVGGSGTFTRNGESGYQNWAWNGFTEWNQDKKSNVLHFVTPPKGRQAEGGGD